MSSEDEQYYLDDSLAKLLLKKKRQSVKRFYRSGVLDTENITAALTSKSVFTRISGDNRRGECHILIDCSGSTDVHVANNLTRLEVMAACALQTARYLQRFFKVKMGLFKDKPLKVFDVPKSLLPEQFATVLRYAIWDEDRLAAFLNCEVTQDITHFTNNGYNDAPYAIRESVKLLQKNHAKSLIIAICDGDPFATYTKGLITEMANFQKKHVVVFSVIDDFKEGECGYVIGDKVYTSMQTAAVAFEKKHGIRTAMTSDADAIKTGGGMVINNTLLKVHESFKINKK